MIKKAAHTNTLMIRKANLSDLDKIEDTYEEHFSYEKEHGAVTVFRKGVYPTRQDAEKAINAGTMYVYEENREIAGSIIVDGKQPEEYQKIAWGCSAVQNEITVIHLLMVRPSRKGRGIAASLVQYAAALAQERSCKAIRLDTGGQNLPAVSLYKKLGFQVAAAAPMKVGGAIEHSGHLFLEKVL